MKKIFLFLILGCIRINGFAVNPIDPPAIKAESPITVSSPAIITSDGCNDLMSLVEVTIIITIDDCPDAYDCDYPAGCSFLICVYEGSTELACMNFSLTKCEYTFEGLRANENATLTSHLKDISVPSCSSTYNTGYDPSPNPVPIGGGTVYIRTTFCP
jgi:hypothetical protein